jgi:hypothetical protein
MRILPAVAGVFREERRLDGQTEKGRDRRTERQRIRQQTENSLAKLIIIFHNLVNSPKVELYSVTLCGE